MKDQAWFYAAFRYLGVNKTVADSFFNLNAQVPGRFTPYVADTSRPGVDDGHIRSVTGRVTLQVSERNKVTYYHDEQDKVRGHWGIASTVPPEASAIQATPTSFVSVSKWTRTQTNKLLFDVGLGVYDQEYQEIYQPDVFAGPVPLVTILDSSTSKIANAWNNPADHFSKLFTESVAASYVTGAHSLRVGMTVSQARWRLMQQFTGDVQPVTYSNGAPVSVTLRIPTDRRNSIDADMGLYAQDHWTISRATISAGLALRLVQDVDESRNAAGQHVESGRHLQRLLGRDQQSGSGLHGPRVELEGSSARASASRTTSSATARPPSRPASRDTSTASASPPSSTTDNANPEVSVGPTDTRAWRDLDVNGSPFNSAGQIQLNELTNSTSTPSFGKNQPASTDDGSVGAQRMGQARLQHGVVVERAARARRRVCR